MLTSLTQEERVERILQMRLELFDIANSFAVEQQGDIAVLLHQACNEIVWAVQRLEALAKRKE